MFSIESRAIRYFPLYLTGVDPEANFNASNSLIKRSDFPSDVGD